MYKPIRHVAEMAIIIFLLYVNILMGAFVQPQYGKETSVLKAIASIYTIRNSWVATIGAIFAYVTLKIVEEKVCR